MQKTHRHTCLRCKTRFDCDGDYSRNPDGYPEAVCDQFHVDNVTGGLCDACVDALYGADLEAATDDDGDGAR